MVRSQAVEAGVRSSSGKCKRDEVDLAAGDTVGEVEMLTEGPAEAVLNEVELRVCVAVDDDGLEFGDWVLDNRPV